MSFQSHPTVRRIPQLEAIIAQLQRDLAKYGISDDERAQLNNRLADVERTAANLTLGEK